MKNEAVDAVELECNESFDMVDSFFEDDHQQNQGTEHELRK